MGGDQGNGMALVILIVMALMVLGTAAAFALAGHLLTRRLAPRRRGLITLLMLLTGAGIGWLLVIATFYQSTLWPPPRLSVATPAGFDAPVLILLEDPRAGQMLDWHGGTLPFTAPTAAIAVPASGVVRVRSFGPIEERLHVIAIWPDGRQGLVAGGGNTGPPGTGASAYLLIAPPDSPPDAGPLSYDGPAIAAYIERRERRR